MTTRRIDPAFFQAFGEFIVYWAGVEEAMQGLFVKMCGGDGLVRLVSGSASQSMIMNWVRGFIEHRFTEPSLRDDLLDVLAEIDNLREQRNTLVHGIWTTHASHEGSVTVGSFRLSREQPIQGRIFTLDDLVELIKDTMAINRRLREVTVRLTIVPDSPATEVG